MGQIVPAVELPDGYDMTTLRRVVGAAYTAFIGSGSTRQPAVEDIMEYTGSMQKNTVMRYMGTEGFKTLIKARGVPWNDEGGLTTQQMLAISVMTDPTNKRTPGQKLKSIGVEYSQYRAWMKNPQFRNKIESVVNQAVGDHINDMQVALVNKAISGDLNAIKFVYEMEGKYDPNSKEVIQLRAMVNVLLEILSRHLSTQPELLQAVATDIQMAMPKAISGEVVR